VRTLALFLETLLDAVALPAGFRVTLPKVTSVRQVEAMVELCAALEADHPGAVLRFELQIETPQAVLGPDGAALVAPMIHASGGRCAGLHYGTYDYSAALGVAAGFQSLEHPAADHAKAVLQVAAAGTGVPVCDGSTNVLPVGDRAAVRAAWSLHARLVRRSLERGYYQGWDLHPAQLPTRFAATFGFYRDGMTAASDRLRAYLDRHVAGLLDEPATARALAGYLLRGLDAGAVEEAEIIELSGLALPDLRALAGLSR
jgi:citrate lyase beta subunit